MREIDDREREDALWHAVDRESHVRRRMLRATVTVGVGLGVGGLLLAGDEPLVAAVVMGCFLLVGLPVAFHWWRDSRALVEVHVVSGDRSALRLRRAGGRTVDIPAVSVSRVHMVATPFLEPDSPGDGTVVLHLHTRQGRYRSRYASMNARKRARSKEAWNRVCPAASFTTGVRTWPLPSGDYD